VEILDHDFDVREVVLNGRLQVAEPDRLESDLGIVIVLYGGLEEQEFHAGR